jgi:hypothetical protein
MAIRMGMNKGEEPVAEYGSERWLKFRRSQIHAARAWSRAVPASKPKFHF